MKRVSSSVPSLEQRHGPVSRRVSVARRQGRDSGPWRNDLQVSRRLSRRPVVPSFFRPTALKEISDLSGCKKVLHPSETLLLAPFRDDVTKKEDKLIKEALFQFICDTKVKI